MKRKIIKYNWRDGKSLEIGRRTLIMGILNVTPDSFSDGGLWNTPERALLHARQMVNEGADVIDIGAESTRPGALPITAEEEIRRLFDILPLLINELPVPVSIDTFRAKTAEFAAKTGVHILNDVWGLQYKEEPGEMARIAGSYGLPVVVMHNSERGIGSDDLIAVEKNFFRRSIKIAREFGVKSIIIDPGIGFGKTADENLEIIRRLSELDEIDGEKFPLLIGASRKSFIGTTLGLEKGDRMEATGAASVLAAAYGCSIVRIHDVQPIARMCRMADAILY